MLRMHDAMVEWITMQQPREHFASHDDALDVDVTVTALRQMSERADYVSRLAQARANLLIDNVKDFHRYHHWKSERQ